MQHGSRRETAGQESSHMDDMDMHVSALQVLFS